MSTKGFITGVNYWASHAGIRMWSDFSAETVDHDFARLSALKIDLIRLFPLWSDFQPLNRVYSAGGAKSDLIFPNDQPLPDTEAGRAGMSEEMLDRFEQVLRLAEKHGLKVAVGLLTGWMSGRLFVPPLLEGKNVLTDPEAVRLELDFIRVFVTRFRNDPVIVGWTSGNETDCLAVANWEQQNVWGIQMRNAIKAADPTRPIMSDMHPLRRAGSNPVRDMRDVFDVCTVHPYVYFTPLCMNEPIDSMRGLLHATAEAKAYEGITKTPCLVEEIGTLGDFVCSKELSAGYARANLFSNWANGMTGMVWWCAHEQTNLHYPPYTHNPLERELGILNADGSEKPVAKAFRAFKEWTAGLDFEITKPKTDAVCVLSGCGDDWTRVLGTYLLAKQAGLNIDFAHQTSIPESQMYLLPSVSGMVNLWHFTPLMERVKKGATLFVSYDSGLIFSEFEAYTGNRLIRNCRRAKDAVCDGMRFSGQFRLELESTGSEVLLQEEDSNPLLTVFGYGKGRVLFCAVPVEKQVAEAVGPTDPGPLAVYRKLAEYADLQVKGVSGRVGFTRHTLADGRQITVAVNYSSEQLTEPLTFHNAAPGKVIYGRLEESTLYLPPFDAAVFALLPDEGK